MSTNARRNHTETSNCDTCTFAGFTLDTRRQLLVRGNEPIRLRPRSYDVLAYLVAQAGRLVSKQELMEAVWGEVAVTDDTLVQSLMEIRRALGDRCDVIKTVRGRGYLLEANVSWSGERASDKQDVGYRPAGVADAPPPPVDRGPARGAARAIKRRIGTWVALAAALALGVAGSWLWTRDRHARTLSGAIRSVAVMPFDNLSGDAQQEYFADGVTDELITQLSKIRALRVISRSSVMRLKGSHGPLKEIARQLDVDAVVQGTVVQSADRVRVTAQVTQLNPERNLWAERYDRPRGDIVMLQGTLASEIADAIRVQLTPQERTRLTRARPVDPDAHEALLKGRYYWTKRTEAATQKAIAYFEQAIAKDPGEAMAFVGLSDAYLSLALSEALQEALAPNEAFPKARLAAQRALEIDESLGEAHASLGHIKFQYDRDWRGAELEFKRAIELTPNYAYAHLTYALCLMWMGRVDEAIAEMMRARALDPLFPTIGPNLGLILARAHQYDRAIEECRKTLEFDPAFAFAHYRLGQIYILSGRYAEAIASLKQAVALSKESPRAMAELGLAYALHGSTGQARALIKTLQQRSRERYVSPFNVALIYGGLRDNDRTIAFLEEAERERSQSMNLLVLSPAFDGVRTDPRFTALVRHIGLSQ
jgi:TolB-like protein/DNA-binding winged helix-turn-helix (wHTH) protein/Flp pilus assembly protein TadD